MLAGRVDSMDTRVFKAESVNQLWKQYPVVFRLALAPFILALVIRYRYENKPFVFANLENGGERLELVNDRLLHSPEDQREMETAAYAAESFLAIEPYDDPCRNAVMSILAVAQTLVWCVQGANVELIVLGSNGQVVPDWAWELQQQGPRVTNVRIISFDPQSDGPSESSPAP